MSKKKTIIKERETKILSLIAISIMAIGIISSGTYLIHSSIVATGNGMAPLSVENYSVDMKFNFTNPARFDTTTFGAAENATDGVDPYWDGIQPPAPGTPNYIQAYFYYPDNPSGQKQLTTSYHDLTYFIQWPLMINVQLGGPGSKDVTATWNTTQVNSWPGHYTIYLETPTGDVDMRTQPRYTYDSLSGYNPFNITATAKLDNDTTPPSITIISGPSGIINCNDVGFKWTGFDDITPTKDLVYSCKLEGYDPSWSSWTSATSKTYNDLPNGNYTFKIRAKDEAGNIGTLATRSFIVEVTGKPNDPPTANFTYKPESPSVKETITFNDTSIDPDGYIINWTWDFDDGEKAYEQNPTHSYKKKGIYNITLKVIDNDGDNDTYSLNITIKEKENGGIPGFEFAFLIVAIAIILFKQKNNKNRKGKYFNDGHILKR